MNPSYPFKHSHQLFKARIMRGVFIIAIVFIVFPVSGQYDYKEEEIKTDSSTITKIWNISFGDTLLSVENQLKNSDTAYLTRYYKNSDVVMSRGKFIDEHDNEIGKWEFYNSDGKHLKTLNYTSGKIEFWADDSLDLKKKFNRSIDVSDSILRVFMCEEFVNQYIQISGRLSLSLIDRLTVKDRDILNRGWALSYNVFFEELDVRHIIDVTIGSDQNIESIYKIPFFVEDQCEIRSVKELDKAAKNHGVRKKRNVRRRFEKVVIEDISEIPLADEIKITPVKLEISYLKPLKETRTREGRRSFREQQKHKRVVVCPFTAELIKSDETWVTISRGTKL